MDTGERTAAELSFELTVYRGYVSRWMYCCSDASALHRAVYCCAVNRKRCSGGWQCSNCW